MCMYVYREICQSYFVEREMNPRQAGGRARRLSRAGGDVGGQRQAACKHIISSHNQDAARCELTGVFLNARFLGVVVSTLRGRSVVVSRARCYTGQVRFLCALFPARPSAMLSFLEHRNLDSRVLRAIHPFVGFKFEGPGLSFAGALSSSLGSWNSWCSSMYCHVLAGVEKLKCGDKPRQQGLESDI